MIKCIKINTLESLRWGEMTEQYEKVDFFSWHLD